MLLCDENHFYTALENEHNFAGLKNCINNTRLLVVKRVFMAGVSDTCKPKCN